MCLLEEILYRERVEVIVVSRSSGKFKYRVFIGIWIQNLLSEVLLLLSTRMRLFCDNTSTIHIAKNLIFHETTKHIEVDYHLVHENVTEDEIIELQYVSSINQLANMLDKTSWRSPDSEYL